MLPITDGIQVGPWLALVIPALVIAGLFLVHRWDR
jgi:hypothetical protein